MSTRTSINSIRRLVDGSSNNISEDLRTIRQSGSPPQYFRAVVTEVIFDPYFYSEEQKIFLKNNITNPDLVDTMPPNSIVGRLITDNQDSFNLPSLFYPFFQSHIMFPLIPGEQVFVIYEDYQKQGTTLGRWITRVHENINVEDINFTHNDRRFLTQAINQTERTSRATESREEVPPSFPNGGNNIDSYSLQQSTDTNPYEDIYRISEGSKIHEYEPVPRWRKRPQELVFQGMNNSLIVLGSDRTGHVRAESDSREIKQKSGTIDIVVGRGRYPLNTNDLRAPANKKTSALVVKNSRNKIEIDKIPTQNKQKNTNEGNPDFSSDAARIFIGMNTNGDTNFKLKHSSDNSVGISFSQNTVRSKETNAGNEPLSSSVGNSFMVAKADHVRIVSRKSEIPDGGTINGSLLLVKEGSENTDLAYLYFNKDGLVQLDGQKIFLGRAATGDLNSNLHQEPYIKWTVYNQHINELKTQIKALGDELERLASLYDTAFSTATSVPYAPVASLVNSVATTRSHTATINNIKQTIDTINPEDAKSSRIFGE